MHFLDRRTVSRGDKRVVAMHEVLIRAYDEDYLALGIAGQVGILKADIARHPKLRPTWWSILEESAKEGRLRALVAKALEDTSIANWHAQLRKAIDMPTGSLGVDEPPVRKPKTEKERRDAGMRPQVGARADLWPVGTTLKVRFLNGAAALQAKVENAAMQWLEYANLKFDFGDDPDAPIRISFGRPGTGTWAYQGRLCLSVPRSEPTANFEWLTADSPREEIDRVVLHEFGHVLGLQHEHGNPASTLKWNKRKVYELLQGPPNFWSRAEVDSNVFTIWPPGYFPVHKVFDRASIMIFSLPAQYFADGKALKTNVRLSDLDKQFVAALYPLRARNRR